MKDQYGRQVKYLRLSVTDRCNLRCRYCMPETGIEKFAQDGILSLEAIEKLAQSFVALGVEKIRITGGEPLVRKGIVNLVRNIKSNPKVKELAMTTNGILLDQFAQDLKDAGLDRVNISLDTLDPQKFFQMTRGGDLSAVLRGIETARKVGLTPIKINVVLVGGFNEDEIETFVGLTQDEDIDVRFIELMPIGEVATWTKSQFLPNETILRKVPSLIPVEAGDPASPATYYTLPNGKGRVGLISPITCKFCSNCNRVRLTSDGKLKYCLHADEEVDLVPYMDNEIALKRTIEKYIFTKPEEHRIGEISTVKRNMYQVGG